MYGEITETLNDHPTLSGCERTQRRAQNVMIWSRAGETILSHFYYSNV